jgi:hypothetical protein
MDFSYMRCVVYASVTLSSFDVSYMLLLLLLLLLYYYYYYYYYFYYYHRH